MHRTLGSEQIARAKAWDCFLVGWATMSSAAGQGMLGEHGEEFVFGPGGDREQLTGFKGEA